MSIVDCLHITVPSTLLKKTRSAEKSVMSFSIDWTGTGVHVNADRRERTTDLYKIYSNLVQDTILVSGEDITSRDS